MLFYLDLKKEAKKGKKLQKMPVFDHNLIYLSGYITLQTFFISLCPIFMLAF